MPIQDFPLRVLRGGAKQPFLPVKIINPHTGKEKKTWGLVHTGADCCCIPGFIAAALGHELPKGQPQSVQGVGFSGAFSHTFKIEILDQSENLFHTITERELHCVENLHVVILGVREFLSDFVLNVHYPKNKFSVSYPRSTKHK